MSEGRKQTHIAKHTLLVAIAAIGGLLAFSSPVEAATGINEQINFQGKVVNTDGTNVATASYTFLFCLYTTASPATPCTSGADNDAVWRESKSVTVTDGIFQTNLGDTTTLPGSVDFNTDNIYLGINFNANGQMSPLVRFTAAPYALNAAKVGGLTVTDTTGTLTIPNGKTISFADDFTTSGAFATTLTSTGITNVTLPTTGTLATLAGAETLTNKVSYNGLVITANTGVVTTGTWNGTDIAVADGGTGTSTGSITGTTALTFTAGGTAQNVNLVSSTTGAAVISSTTATTDTIKLQPTAGAASFAGIITTADLTVSDKTYTFPDSNITINAAADISGTTLASNVVTSSLTTVGTLGSLTVSGAITANGGISLSASQSLAAAALAYVDLGLITHSTTANQGLRLPNAASASPSSPTSGEGYLAWDAAGNQLITYNGSAWAAVGGGSGYNLIKDEASSLTARTTLAFLGAGVSCADSGSQTECTIAGGSGGDLQTTYGGDADGSDATISLTSADDSLVFSNPAASGTDSTFTVKVEQLNTGVANDALYVDNRGTGNGLRIDDASGDTTPFIVDGSGNVGIQTTTAAEALQVGSGTNRANVSAYGDVTSEGYDIQRTLAEIIDIFVYDTTRDSDGGEWRNSLISQQMSWATETKDNTGAACVIATDDRCGKSVFPRKAIIATTATALYIFDGSDNTLWMKFTQDGTYAMGADTNNNPSGVGAQNGVIAVGTNGASATGMYTFDFKQDTMFRYNVTNRVMGDKNIGNRNSTVTYATDANTNFALVDTIVNDVSIAMITSSTNGMANTLTLPTDSALTPVRGMTLLAAATDSGISVVNMASRKTLNYSDATGNDYNQVVMTSRARLYATNEALGQLEEWRNMDRDVVSEVNGTPDRFYDETTPTGSVGKTPITTGTAPTINTTPGSLAVIERASSARESAATTLLESGDIVFVGTNQGLAEVHTSGGNLVGASWSKLTTTTVATPYMVGAPRGAFLFEEAAGATATTSAIGTAGTTKNVLDSAVTGTAPTFGANGVRGTSVNFNNNSYLCTDANADGTCDSDTDFNAGTIGFTVSLWFKHGTTAAADTLFERCYTPATPAVTVGCIYAGMHTTGQIRFAIDSLTTWTYNTTYDDTILSTASYNDNQWHHAVFTNTDTDICLYIDGKQAAACDTAISATATMDAAQVLTVGGTCAGAACVTGANFWDGQIDDFVWSSNGATTDNGLAGQSATKLYLDGRAHLIRPSDTAEDATAFSSTTIGDSAEAYIPGSFVGLIVELTGGTGIGQTRTIISNDATTFTVYPAFTVTPDATTDYQVNAAKLYGATNGVTAIAVDAPTNLNKVRKVYVGTNNGSDGGGISVFTNAGTGSIKTEVIHSDAAYVTDDFGSTWSGTDADDISAIASYSDTVALGSSAFMRAQRKEISLKQLQLDTIGAFEDIRQELVSKQLFGSTQDVLGLGQGADLAERYYSHESLNAGEIVSIDTAQEAGVMRSTAAYQRDVLGVVATAPGIVLGPAERTPYPIALVGRVPVKVTNENGQIYAGDRITASSRPGYGMFANQAGRVIGEALSDAVDWEVCEGENPTDVNKKLCTSVLVFVNLNDYSGMPVELAMSRTNADSTVDQIVVTGLENSSPADALSADGATVRLAATEPTREEKILTYLKQVRDDNAKKNTVSSEIFTGRVAASGEVITPILYADQIFAKSIKADSIEGLQVFTDQISSLQEKYAGLNTTVTTADVVTGTSETVKEQLSIAMKKLSADTITVQLDGSILGKLTVAGALRVGGEAEFAGDTLFTKLSTFLGSTLFKGDVAFEKTPTFGNDTAGFAVVQKGEKRVRVVFDAAYDKQPIVAVSMTNDVSPLLEDGADKDLKADIALVEKDYLDTVFDADMKYIVTEKNTTGFTIVLNKKAPVDLQFSWVAIAVKKAKLFNSEKEPSEEEVPAPQEEETVPPAIVPLPAELPPVDATISTPTTSDSEEVPIVSETTPSSVSNEGVPPVGGVE